MKQFNHVHSALEIDLETTEKRQASTAGRGTLKTATNPAHVHPLRHGC